MNPTLENKFQPILTDSINKAKSVLLKEMGLTNKVYQEEILPRLLLSLDRKR